MFVPIYTWPGIINLVNSMIALVNLVNPYLVHKDV